MIIKKIIPIGKYAGITIQYKNFNNLSIIYGNDFHPDEEDLFEVGCCYERFDTWEEVIEHLDKNDCNDF